jgi:3-isopropylmalate dehydrogenase
MLLRESFGLSREAACVEAALDEVWTRGFRTEDLREPGCHVVGTREFGSRVADAVACRVAGGAWDEDLAPTG